MTKAETQIIKIYERHLLRYFKEVTKKTKDDEAITELEKILTDLTPYVKIIIPLLKIDEIKDDVMEKDNIIEKLSQVLNRA